MTLPAIYGAAERGATGILAGAFVGVLRDWLGPAVFAIIRQRNASEAYGANCCASHDFCDANMAMDAAFPVALGRPCALCEDEEGFESPDFELWNRAWGLAKGAALTARPRAHTMTAEAAGALLDAAQDALEVMGAAGLDSAPGEFADLYAALSAAVALALDEPAYLR